MHHPLRVLDAARSVHDEVILLLEGSIRVLHAKQLRDAAGSIPFNIRESLGKRKGPERNQLLRVARGSTEEVDEQLSANERVGRLQTKRFWSLHRRLVVIHKMLTNLMTAP